MLVELPADEAHHALRVRRLPVGTAVQLLDGCGGYAQGVLQELPGRRAGVQLILVRQVPAPALRLEVVAATPKGDEADAMVDRLAQLGCDVWRPLVSERTVVRPREGKLGKHARIAREAAKQCLRLHDMEVQDPIEFPLALTLPGELRLLAQPLPKPCPFAPLAALQAMGQAGRVLVLVGPEGGFSGDEVAAATAHGWIPWCFADHVLRIETATEAAVALLRAMASR
jgi:16S rRNA (uracil1498-N3)-methyltransferase